MNLSGNTVLITGGSTGIGFALAEAFLSAGSCVVICGRREDKLNEAKNKLPGLHIKVCDVSDIEQQKELFKWTTSEFPDLNILINNAGIQRDIDLVTGYNEMLQGESEIKINLEAPILLTGLFIQHLIQKENAAVVNVSSGLAFTPMTRVPIYCATKAALHTYTLLLRQQLSKTRIKVFEIIPPIVDTELNKEGREKRGVQFRGIQPDLYIKDIINDMENDEFEIYHGMTKNSRNLTRAELENRLMNMPGT